MEALNSLVLAVFMGFMITLVTVFVSPVIAVSDGQLPTTPKGFPVEWVSYVSTSNIPVIGSFLDPFAFLTTANFNLMGFLIDMVFWMGICLFAFNLIGKKGMEA